MYNGVYTVCSKYIVEYTGVYTVCSKYIVVYLLSILEYILYVVSI